VKTACKWAEDEVNERLKGICSNGGQRGELPHYVDTVDIPGELFLRC